MNNWNNEFIYIARYNAQSNILFCKITNRPNRSKSAETEGNEVIQREGGRGEGGS